MSTAKLCEGHTQTPEKMNIWARILGSIVGPTYLTGDLYLEIHQHVIH